MNVERLLLVVALVMFILASVIGFRHLPEMRNGIRWPFLLLAGSVGVPLTVLLNALEYRLSARILAYRVPLTDSLRVSLVASAANALPIPGSVLVRIRALRKLGSGFGGATASTAAVGVTWVGVTGFLAGALLLPERVWGVAAGFLILSLILIAGGYLVLRTQARVEPAPQLMSRVVLVEAGFACVIGFRYYLVLMALGFDASFGQAVALGVSVVLAAATGIFPGGLGLRELLAGAISPLVGLPAAAGVVITAIDRLVAVVVLSLISAVMLVSPFTPRMEVASREAPRRPEAENPDVRQKR